MKIYCQSCGSPVNYGSKKPSFCPDCGKKLSSETGGNKSQAPSPSAPLSRMQQAIIEDEEHDVTSVPNINGLDVEIETATLNSIKIEDAVGTLKPEQIGRFKRPDDKSKADILDTLRKEGGALRSQSKQDNA